MQYFNFGLMNFQKLKGSRSGEAGSSFQAQVEKYDTFFNTLFLAN